MLFGNDCTYNFKFLRSGIFVFVKYLCHNFWYWIFSSWSVFSVLFLCWFCSQAGSKEMNFREIIKTISTKIKNFFYLKKMGCGSKSGCYLWKPILLPIFALNFGAYNCLLDFKILTINSFNSWKSIFCFYDQSNKSLRQNYSENILHYVVKRYTDVAVRF